MNFKTITIQRYNCAICKVSNRLVPNNTDHSFHFVRTIYHVKSDDEFSFSLKNVRGKCWLSVEDKSGFD